MNRLPIRLLTAAFALLAALPLHAQEGGDEKQDPKKLAEWPSLKKAEDRRVRALAKQFRKEDEQLHEDAHGQLVAIGAGVAPILIPMANDRPKNVNAHLFAVLDAVTTPEHAALLAREANRPSVELRRYLLRRLGTFRDKEVAPVMKAALTDKDPEIVFQAGLGLLALGDDSGVEPVLAAARQEWSERHEQIEKALPRSRETATKVLTRIASARPTEQMAGLRLLRSLMVKEQAVMLRHYLQSSDFTVKREAINAARVLHGQEPLEKLASFQAINMAKEWLDKL